MISLPNVSLRSGLSRLLIDSLHSRAAVTIAGGGGGLCGRVLVGVSLAGGGGGLCVTVLGGWTAAGGRCFD